MATVMNGDAINAGTATAASPGYGSIGRLASAVAATRP
jgi:hypothetical protein